MDGVMQEVEEHERVIVGADLNGHVGCENEAIGRVHGGHGIGERNPEGENVVDFAVALDMAIVNTFFMKKREHLITYRTVIRRHGKELLGETSGIIWEERESWWWEEDIGKVVKDKKEAKKRWEESQSVEDRDRFREKNKVVKKMVAQAKAKAYDDVYNELGTKEGLNKMIKLSKARNKNTKDITHIKQIKDQDGVVLRKEEDIMKRWKEYFEQLLNEENNRLIRGDGQVNIGMVMRFSKQEVLDALKKMKNGKATGPDMIPVEAWKALGDEGVDILYDLMIKILEQEKIPNEWHGSILIPIFKGEEMSKSVILERMIDARLREEVEISKEQMGFMKGRGTTDGIFCLRQLMEKFGEKQRDLHMVFIDLEKALTESPDKRYGGA
ncbi:uncharacterized protein [Macrobrachium rosenbergii]|uniref:uncharacterized protein n=1 Tax=Macrobrachium rosenbergii TaxID=79674 RepID=UPI0034D7572A